MATSKTFTFATLPTTKAQLTALPEYALNSPFATAALTVLAMHAYTLNTQNGIEMFDAIKGPQPLSAYDKQFLKDRLSGKEYLPSSYMQGSSPQNGYTPTTPYTITVSDNPYSYDEQNYAKLYITSSGADYPRPIKLRAKGEQWFLWENMLLPSIRVPVAQDPWA